MGKFNLRSESLSRRYSKIIMPLSSVLLLSTLIGCTIASTRFGSKELRPEIRDVSHQARGQRDASLRKRVMVLPFINAAGRSEKAAQYARESFIRSLRKTDDFVVVANTDFPKDVTGYLKNGEYDLEAMGKLAGSIGVAAIIEGKILEVKAKRIGDDVGLVREVRARIDATVQMRVVSGKNGSIVMNETRTAQAEDSTYRYAERSFSDKMLADDPQLIEAVLVQAFKNLVPRIAQNVEKLSWEGRVAMVKGDRVYLNAGRLSGIQIGDILKITEDGEDVYDPESGSLLGKVPGRLKGTVEVVTYFGRDGSIGIVHSGSGFRENDKVELY